MRGKGDAAFPGALKSRLKQAVSKAFILIALLSLFGIAEAHSPYITKIATLKNPSGQPLVLESLSGDGMMVSDPVKLLIRNRHGAVIAYSPTGYRMAYYCPVITSCWALPYSGTLLIKSWRLDYQHLDYERRPQAKNPLDARDAILPDPASFLDAHEGFVAGNSKLKLLSPLIILWDNLLGLLILAVIFFGFAALLVFVFKGFNTQQGAKKSYSSLRE